MERWKAGIVEWSNGMLEQSIVKCCNVEVWVSSNKLAAQNTFFIYTENQQNFYRLKHKEKQHPARREAF